MIDEKGAETDLNQVELSIEQAKKKIRLGKALDVLRNNQYFKELFLDEYLNAYAVQMVKNKASFGMRSEDQQKFIDNEINAIGSFDQFLRFISMEAHMAKESIKADEETREEILAEDV